jgi:hypothetical protein
VITALPPSWSELVDDLAGSLFWRSFLRRDTVR